MKTLKFMLAAATAIGLASATQADQFNTTGFEKLTVGDSVTTGVKDNSADNSYFYYAGETAEDNESVIAAADAELANIARPRGASAVDATRNNILQVSTGTDPLMRTYESTSMQGGELKPQPATTLTGDVYVDTLVQFTVTPYTDTVTPSANDKLMIYLKESTNEVEGVINYSTNLVVVGKYHDVDSVVREYKVDGLLIDGTSTPTEFAPNTWYRLTVKVLQNVATTGKYPGFMVYINGNLCVFDSATANMQASTVSRYYRGVDAVTAKQVVLSLLADGSTDASLQGVGFAGEGKVDDIVFSDLNPFATVFDFTFTAWDSDKVDAVSYTVGVGGTATTLAGTHEVEEGTKVKINSITYKSGWQEGSFTVVGMADPDLDGWYTVTNTASFTIVPAQAAPSGEELEPGEQSSTTYASQAAAEAALANVTIAASDAVVAALDSAAQSAYLAKFEKRVVETGSGEYKVEVGLTAAAEADLQAEVDADAAEVIEDLSESDVTLTTTPGFYYSFEYGTTLEGMTEVGTRTLATGSTLTLPRPTTANATAGFYKVLVNVVPATVTP